MTMPNNWTPIELASIEVRTGYAAALDEMFHDGYAYVAACIAEFDAYEVETEWLEGYKRGAMNATYGAPAHIWTEMSCPAYLTQRGSDCTCGGAK